MWPLNLWQVFPVRDLVILVSSLRRALRVGALAAPAGIFLAFLAPPAATAEPVHGGGVGSCDQCHVMHDALAGQIAYVGNNPLLLAATSTDLCLTCHGTNGVFGTNPLAPPPERGAGNFVWLLEDNLNDDPDGNAYIVHGQAAGHSIVSPARGIAADTRWTHAPGGTFPSGALGCTSCHDPHGNSNFRMLHGAGSVQDGQAVFLYPAPLAEGLSAVDPGVSESPIAHTAYRAGVSAWCANCHGEYHAESAGGTFEHPVSDTIDSEERRRYNAYAGDASPNGGAAATSYLPQVAFEGPLTGTSSTAGPATSDRIMCLTCHRAHASSAPAAGRWDFHVYRLVDDGVASGSYPLQNPYPGSAQGQLCRKCHSENHDQGRACLGCHATPLEGPTPMAP